ncbi:MAG: hypothetical protein WB821_14405 [Burkholderiaceae bacterium]
MSTFRQSPTYPRAVQPAQALTVIQAIDNAPTLARLATLARQSQQWLATIAPLLPAALRTGVQAGPIENQQWCLLAANNAVAAKLRQLSPALSAHLRAQGCEVNAIRIKVQMPRAHSHP